MLEVEFTRKNEMCLVYDTRIGLAMPVKLVLFCEEWCNRHYDFSQFAACMRFEIGSLVSADVIVICTLWSVKTRSQREVPFDTKGQLELDTKGQLELDIV